MVVSVVVYNEIDKNVLPNTNVQNILITVGSKSFWFCLEVIHWAIF